MFHLSDGDRIIWQFGKRVGWSRAYAVGSVVVGTHRGASSPLTESAVAAAAATAGSIFLPMVLLLIHRIMIA